ncbi:MAG: RluA family pseudouridine synthase [Mariprofundaceae bacterium]|nr:RluA family pseudouridine synthase [Mariprofundaceae bacterium]
MNDFRDYRLDVPGDVMPLRLDAFLAEHLPLSRRRIRTAIDDGGVYVNRRRCRKAGRLLKGGEKLRLVLLENEQHIPFSPEQLVWTEPPLYLIHKRSGQYAQEALHRSLGTLPDELAQHLQLAADARRLLRPVHRLDHGTSGLMLLSSDPAQLQHLQDHWHSHVSKEYLAVVEPAPAWETQYIALPVSKLGDRHGRYPIHNDGRPCETDATVLERRKNRALLRLIPHTGRTHQLRVHLSALGCPILGDHRYGGRPHHRLMLHAHMLAVQAPAMDREHRWQVDPEEDWKW